jgi:hypothetical protein
LSKGQRLLCTQAWECILVCDVGRVAAGAAAASTTGTTTAAIAATEIATGAVATTESSSAASFPLSAGRTASAAAEISSAAWASTSSTAVAAFGLVGDAHGLTIELNHVLFLASAVAALLATGPSDEVLVLILARELDSLLELLVDALVGLANLELLSDLETLLGLLGEVII